MGDHRSNPLAFGTTIKAPTLVKDRLGRTLALGDVVLLGITLPPVGLTWRVAKVAPVLDPRSQPNLGVVTLQATFTLTVPLNGQPVQELIRVADVRELAPGDRLAPVEEERPTNVDLPPTLD